MSFDLFRHRRVAIVSWGVRVQGCASLLLSTLFSLGGLPTHPQNPHSWRTSLSLLRSVRLGRSYREHKVVARPSLLYGSETWVTTQRDMIRLAAAEIRFLRSVTEYTRLDKIRSENIRQELEISGIQDVRLKYKQNWINNLERMDNTRLPKHALTYKPRGRRDHGRPRKQWQRVDAGTG